MKKILLALVMLTFAVTVRPGGAQQLVLSLVDGGNVIEFSLQDLDEMPQESFSTRTTWTEGVVTFSGVSLSHVLKSVGESGSLLRMVALNDYAVEMPISEVGETYPIIATRMNGETMKVRDKGPYWIVYPYDSDPDYRTETSYARSIWQLKTLSVIE